MNINTFAQVFEDNPRASFDWIQGLWVFLGVLITILILWLLTSRFLYRPMSNHVSKRRDKIKSDIDNAEKMNIEATADREKAAKELKGVKREAKKIMELSKQQAEDERKEIISKAQSQSESMLDGARNQIEKETAKAKEKANKDVASLAIMAAEKIIEKEVDTATNKKMVQDLIKKVSK